MIVDPSLLENDEIYSTQRAWTAQCLENKRLCTVAKRVWDILSRSEEARQKLFLLQTGGIVLKKHEFFI